MKTLYISDLDGTLLDSSERVSDYTASVLNRLIQRGFPFSYATARSLASARIVTSALDIISPVIVYNGCFIRDSRTGADLHSCFLNGEDIRAVRAVLGQYGILPICYSIMDGLERVCWMEEALNDGMRHYLRKRQGDKRFIKVSSEDELYQGRLFYFTCIGDKEGLCAPYAALSRIPSLRCTFQQELYRTEYWMEAMPAGASKATAIETLKGMLGCARVVSFGDAVNDLPMFRVSQACYAVQNAAQPLKDAATGILLSNDQDGVAHWLEENVLACAPAASTL